MKQTNSPRFEELAQPQVAQPMPRLVARWDLVDNKLTCRWFSNPD